MNHGIVAGQILDLLIVDVADTGGEINFPSL